MIVPQTVPCPRPPRIAAWLVELFVSVEQAESILGDLHEEFSDVASKSGVVAARRWYWRQSINTLAHQPTQRGADKANR